MALVKYNNNSISAITSAAAIPAGAMTLIKEQTASSSSTISFVHGTSDVVLDGTYPIYVFKFINVHPATDSVHFQVNFRDGGSSYDATKTSSVFEAYHLESNDSALGYKDSNDLAQSTGVQRITSNIGNDNDQCGCGELWLFAPSSTTFVKHFIVRSVHYGNPEVYAEDYYAAGYCNVTAAIDAVQFSMSSGNIDAGTIKLYGIKDS